MECLYNSDVNQISTTTDLQEILANTLEKVAPLVTVKVRKNPAR